MMVNDGPCPCVIVMDLGARYANESVFKPAGEYTE